MKHRLLIAAGIMKLMLMSSAFAFEEPRVDVDAQASNHVIAYDGCVFGVDEVRDAKESGDGTTVRPPILEQVDLLRERLKLLREIERLHEATYKKGESSLKDLLEAKIEVLQAELQLAGDDAQRQEVYGQLLGFARQLEPATQKRFESDQATQADVLNAKAFRLKIEAASMHQAAQRQADNVRRRSELRLPSIRLPPAEVHLQLDEVRLQSLADLGMVDLQTPTGAEERRLEERLLQLDVEAAEVVAAVAQNRESRLRASRERGDRGVTGIAVEEAQAELLQKEIELKRAQTRLELFQVRAKRRSQPDHTRIRRAEH